MAIKWLNAIHHSIHHLIIRRKSKDKNQTREFIGLEDAKNIAILYIARNQKSIDRAIDLGKKLGENKKISLLGFIPKKTGESLRSLYPEMSFISKKDLSWYRVPKRLFSSRFIKGDYDILINLYLKDSLPLQYISCLSKAKFRIGHYRPKNLYCNDFLIDLKGKDDIEEYIELIYHFTSGKKEKNE